MSIYFTLFWEFFQAGLFAVGGGMATIPFLNSMADRFDWLTHQQLADMIAVSESTPGPIGVNCATYAGYHAAGVGGALVATFALVLPSFIIILLISKALERYRNSLVVTNAFTGLRPAATGLIAAAAWSVIASALLNISALSGGVSLALFRLPQLALFAVFMILSNIKPLKNWHPLAFIALAAVAGIVFQL